MKKLLFVIIFTLLISTPAHAETKKLYDIPLEGSLQYYVVDACDRNDISPELVFAVMEVESCFVIDITDSTNRYIGLMQIHKSSHKELQQKLDCPNLYDPEDNITVGCGILKELFQKYHDVDKVLMAYNGGEDYMLQLTKKGIYSTPYTRKVLKAQERMYEYKQ